MKKYLLFCGETHYPQGGARDYIRSFDSVEDAITEINKRGVDDWAQTDAVTQARELIKEFDRDKKRREKIK